MKNYFLSYTTLPFGQKRFVHFKGPKNVLCHGLTQRQEIQIFHMVCQRNFSTAEVRGIFRFLFTKFFFVFDFGHFLFLIIRQISPQCKARKSLSFKLNSTLDSKKKPDIKRRKESSIGCLIRHLRIL